jgi:hypothetical protein
LTQGIVGGLVGVFVTILVFKLLRNTEIEEVWRALNQKLTRNKVVVLEPEKLDA